VPRPDDEALLHPECYDMGDLREVAAVRHWRDLADADVVSAYAALAFLSPAGFRHYLPAFLRFVLRHPDSGEAVVDSTVWAFLPELYQEELRPFVRSKWTDLAGEERDVVAAFLDVMTAHHDDAAAALAAWRGAR
jgi:uncharacterized protein DUF6714